jgi:hypothetical protein
MLIEDRGAQTKKLVVHKFCDERVIAAELELEERIDAKIEKDIVALGKIKTMKTMGLGRHSTSDIGRQSKETPLAHVEKIEALPLQPERGKRSG